MYEAKYGDYKKKYEDLYDECHRIYSTSAAVNVDHDEDAEALKKRYGLTDKDLGLDGIEDSSESNYKSKGAKKGKQSYKKTMHAKKV
jgi:hypothetical protein